MARIRLWTAYAYRSDVHFHRRLIDGGQAFIKALLKRDSPSRCADWA